MSQQQKIFADLARVAELVPTPIYWLDTDAVLLGANEKFFKTLNIPRAKAIGKTAYDVYPREMAEYIIEHDKKVMHTGMSLAQEEPTLDISTGKARYFTAFKAPLYDEQHKVIGLIGTLIETTAEKARAKMTVHQKIFEDFARVTQLLPTPIYWLDINAKLLGANEHFYKSLGITPSFNGANAYDVYPQEIAKHIIEHDLQVMRTGIASRQEEPTRDISTGKPRYFNAFKAPICDENDTVIGLVGTLIEITAEKEAQKLKLENETHQVQLQEQEKFTKIANQVAHDIRSPLASLLMIIKACTDIPEDERISLREAAISIDDIANNLLNRYQQEDDAAIKVEERQAILVSARLLQILADKKYQYTP